MNKRKTKKAERKKGCVLISAWVPPETRTALNERAKANYRSVSQELNAILAAVGIGGGAA